ncbi:MAG: DUF192 domain-containing protein [Lentisphaerae bacterium]|nr:DUF192 domain-containing protein [Lentisphaerota bacterium]
MTYRTLKLHRRSVCDACGVFHHLLRATMRPKTGISLKHLVCMFGIAALFFGIMTGCSVSRTFSGQMVKIETRQEDAVFEIVVADTPESRERGLMFVRNLPENRGMLFVFQDEEIRSFWMKNTYIPLDIIFISSKGVIVDIKPNAVPLDESPIVSIAPAKYVLEIGGGLATKYHIRAGDSVHFL